MDDWELIAQVDHSNYDGNVFHKINFDIEIPEQYRTTDQFLCEHCHSNRQRNFTYIVYRESEFKQVGSTCLKDFCGHSFNIVNSYLNDLNELSENCGESRINPMVNRNQFLELVAFTARTRGYVTGKEYYEKTGTAGGTGRDSWYFIFDSKEDKCGVNIDIIDDDKLLAKEAVEIINNLEIATRNDFQQSLYIAGKNAFLDFKNAGVVAYSIKMAMKAREEKNSVDVSNSKFIGNIGDKGIVLNVTVTAKEAKDEYYLIKMATTNGDSLVWFGSFGSFADDMKLGQNYKIKVNIKKHNNYRGINSTQVNRVKEI